VTPAPGGGFGQELAAGPFVRVPPRRHNIQVPVPSRRAALAGLALYAPCRFRTLVAHHAGWALVGVLGPRVLPATRGAWQPPMEAERWESVCADWRRQIGPFDALALYERPQASRSGVSALLLDDGRPRAFVKLRQEATRLEVSERVLTALAAAPSAHFHAPTPLAAGAEDDWEWLALSPMPLFPHRPPRRPPLARIVADLQDRLAPVLDGTGVPSHWRPMHGDLTPWNLRRVGPWALWLLDWEEVGWGPPRADEVYYAATASVLLGSTRGVSPADAEAVRFWRGRVGSRPSGDFDRVLNDALGAILATMAGPAGDEPATAQEPGGDERGGSASTASSKRSAAEVASKLASTWRRAALPIRDRRSGSSSSDSTAETNPGSSSGGTR
jgi:Phosphotransferase enzyme family